MEWILGTIFLMLLKVHYLPGLSDIIVFAPISIYVGILLLAVMVHVLVAIGKWNERRKRRKDWRV
jgi:hypothetical protein